jgi:hypothetical protein
MRCDASDCKLSPSHVVLLPCSSLLKIPREFQPSFRSLIVLTASLSLSHHEQSDPTTGTHTAIYLLRKRKVDELVSQLALGNSCGVSKMVDNMS